MVIFYFISELIKEKYTFDSKVKTNAEFININESIKEQLKEVTKKNFQNTKSLGFIREIGIKYSEKISKDDKQIKETLQKISII